VFLISFPINSWTSGIPLCSGILEVMEELVFDSKKFISSKRAAELTGYAKDYVGQLCRMGKVVARQVGRAWYIEEESILRHKGIDSNLPEAMVREPERIQPEKESDRVVESIHQSVEPEINVAPATIKTSDDRETSDSAYNTSSSENSDALESLLPELRRDGANFDDLESDLPVKINKIQGRGIYSFEVPEHPSPRIEVRRVRWLPKIAILFALFAAVFASNVLLTRVEVISSERSISSRLSVNDPREEMIAGLGLVYQRIIGKSPESLLNQ